MNDQEKPVPRLAQEADEQRTQEKPAAFQEPYTPLTEESLARVIGAGLNIVRVVESIPNRVRTPDLNQTPVQAIRLHLASPSTSGKSVSMTPSTSASGSSAGSLGDLPLGTDRVAPA